MSPFPTNEGEKFAFIAVRNVRSSIPAGQSVTLPDGTLVLTGIGAILEGQPHWKDWLGTLRVGALKRAGIVLFRSEPGPSPEVLGAQHSQLAKQVTKVFYMLRLGAVLEYEGADGIQGSFLNNELQVRSISEVPPFRPTRGSPTDAVTIDSLHQAARRATRLNSIESELPSYRRIIRGLNTLMEGLRCELGQDRMHQFVRSLEALILPDQGKTRKQFGHRCKTFARARNTTDVDRSLSESFDMRCDTEHMHDWDRSLQTYPEHDRDNVALQRTRQMERMACLAYCRALDDPNLMKIFENDTTLKAFWASQENTRTATFGAQLDLDAIPIVRHYDGWGRPVLKAVQ